jgi:MoaA/NifB/PqqE/SkfB family radical SAM enzyme
MKSKKNVKVLYDQFGDKMCLSPFVQAFYSTNSLSGVSLSGTDGNHVRPCTVIASSPKWNILNNSIGDSYNSAVWKDVRQTFLDGDLHPMCTTCINAENAGSSSPRILANEYMFEHIDADVIMGAMHEIANNNLNSHKILTLDWMPSNYCNYSCIMCFGAASSQRYAFEIKKGFPKRKYNINKVDLDFFDLIKHVEILGFTGGETILQPEVHELIDYLIQNNLSQKLIITILTNVSEFPDKLIEKFKQFKKVLYTVSIDGTGEIIEYQRRGAVWSNVATNAVRIFQASELHAIVNHVVTGVNILNAMDFIDWCKDNKIYHIAISKVYQSHLGPEVLPPELRKLAWSRLIEGRRRYQNFANSSYEKKWLDSIDKLISIIETSKHSKEDLQKFIKHIKEENTESKRPLHEIVPEWAPWFTD